MSNNANTFKHYSKEIVRIAQAEEFRSHLTNRQVEWQFIVEMTARWGITGKDLFKVSSVVLKRPLGSTHLTLINWVLS